jgi:hypothetical protein
MADPIKPLIKNQLNAVALFALELPGDQLLNLNQKLGDLLADLQEQVTEEQREKVWTLHNHGVQAVLA